MIVELLNNAINEVHNQNYYITEFQLGVEPMRLFVAEFKSSCGIPKEANITTVNTYNGIPVTQHQSEDAVMYCISLKQKTPC